MKFHLSLPAKPIIIMLPPSLLLGVLLVFWARGHPCFRSEKLGWTTHYLEPAGVSIQYPDDDFNFVDPHPDNLGVNLSTSFGRHLYPKGASIYFSRVRGSGSISKSFGISDWICGRRVQKTFSEGFLARDLYIRQQSVFLTDNNRLFEARLTLAGENYLNNEKEEQYNKIFEEMLRTIRFDDIH